MYDQFYGLSGRPFQLTPDPFFYFESGTHRKAMSYLGYGLAQGEGFIVITGDVGAGKTTLVGHLMNNIDPGRLTAVKLVSTQVEGDDLLRLVAEQFQIAWDGLGKAELLRSVEQFLREQARAGKRTLLIVDEGQNLAISALEELRMLSNFQLGGHSLLQIFLLGQPEFRQTLFHSPTLEQLRQRVIATHHLDPMEPEEVEPYILHRLGKVGWNGNPSFSPDAYEAIFDYSGGVPRKLNVLVSRVLLYGAVEQLTRITGQHVRDVIAEVSADGGAEPVAETAPEPAPALAIAPEPAPVSAPLPAAKIEPAPVAAPDLAWPTQAPAWTTEIDAPAVDVRSAFAAMTASQPVADDAPQDDGIAAARNLLAEEMAGAGQEVDLHSPQIVPDAAEEDEAPLELQMTDREFAPVSFDESAEVRADLPEPDQMVALHRQIAGLEARLADQDAALRRVLDLLIEWVERDPVNAPAAQNWAA